MTKTSDPPANAAADKTDGLAKGSKIVTATAANPDPLDRPNVSGLASGFLIMDCTTTPDTARPTPVKIASKIRGRRNSTKMDVKSGSPIPIKDVIMSRGGMLMSPKLRLMTLSAIIKTERMINRPTDLNRDGCFFVLLTVCIYTHAFLSVFLRLAK